MSDKTIRPDDSSPDEQDRAADKVERAARLTVATSIINHVKVERGIDKEEEARELGDAVASWVGVLDTGGAGIPWTGNEKHDANVRSPWVCVLDGIRDFPNTMRSAIQVVREHTTGNGEAEIAERLWLDRLEVLTTTVPPSTRFQKGYKELKELEE